MSHELRAGLSRLETTTRFTLAVLALASGVYTYLGVRGLLNGTTSIVFFGAIIYSVAVSVGIYAFWSYLMRFLPHTKQASSRGLLYLSMAIGSVMIIAMSSWLNAAALAGGAALEQHLANAIEDYQARLDKAHSNALAAESLLPDIRLASRNFARLAKTERSSGALTGTSGSGTVVQLLTQMASQLEGLARQVEDSRDRVKNLFTLGSKHLAQMRKLVSSSGPIEQRSNAFAEEAVALAGVISALQQTSIAPAVKRAADDLGKGFIAPAANGRDAALAERQSEVVIRVEKAVRQRSRLLSQAADQILARPQAAPLRFVPLSTPEAVLLYATDFLPSWAGAISIDLLPGVLIIILCAVQSAIRREEGGELDEHLMTAGDMMRALKLYNVMHQQGFPPQTVAAAPASMSGAPVTGPPHPAPTADEAPGEAVGEARKAGTIHDPAGEPREAADGHAESPALLGPSAKITALPGGSGGSSAA